MIAKVEKLGVILEKFVMVDTDSGMKFSMALQRKGISHQFHQNGAEASVTVIAGTEGLESVVKRYMHKIKLIEYRS